MLHRKQDALNRRTTAHTHMEHSANIRAAIAKDGKAEGNKRVNGGKQSTILFSHTKEERTAYQLIDKPPAERSHADCEALAKYFLSHFKGGRIDTLARDMTWDMKLTIARHMVFKRCPWKGEVVVRQGDEDGHEFYFIFKGIFTVWDDHPQQRNSRRTLIAHLHEGQSFGEQSLILDEPRSATVMADNNEKDSMTSDGELLIITREAFKEIFHHKELEKLRSCAEFLTGCSFFNDRKAWHVRDLEFLARRLKFKTVPINKTLWVEGDPVSPTNFVPIIRRGEAHLVVALETKSGEKVHVNFCSLGAGAVLLDHAVMEVIDMYSRKVDKRNVKTATFNDSKATQRRRRNSLMKLNGKRGKGMGNITRSASLVYGMGVKFSEHEPLVRHATLVTSSCVQMAWLNLTDFQFLCSQRKVGMEARLVEKEDIDMSLVSYDFHYHGIPASPEVEAETKRWAKAVEKVDPIIKSNLEQNVVAYPSTEDLTRLYSEMTVWKSFRDRELDVVIEEKWKRTHTMNPGMGGPPKLPAVPVSPSKRRGKRRVGKGKEPPQPGGVLAEFCRQRNIDLYDESSKEGSKTSSSMPSLTERPQRRSSSILSVMSGGGKSLAVQPIETSDDEDEADLEGRKFSIHHGIDANCNFRVHGGEPLIDMSTLGKYGALRDQVNTTGIPSTRLLAAGRGALRGLT